MRVLRRLRWAAPAALLVIAGCGQTPDETEKARGLLTGVNLVAAMTVLFVVIAVGLIGGAVAIDRMIRSRKALVEGPPVVEEEETDEVVAGITVGRAPVPRWLYAAYVLIPIFAMAYVFSNVAAAPATASKTPVPTPSGPCTACTIEASQIQFTTKVLTVAAGKPVTVTFDNKDVGVPHTFTVWPTEAATGKSIADTGTVAGGAKRDAKFTAPAAGSTLFFNCTIHPASMKGTIEAK